MHVTMSLFEGIILLFIGGIFTVAWWGVKRIVKINDDEAKTLEGINDNLKQICERLARGDTWMEMHANLDDERHEENKVVLKDLREAIDALKEKLA